MDAQQVIELLDFYWFEQKIISSSPPSPPPPTPTLQIPKESQKPELSCLQSRHVRSSSDELSSQTSFISEYEYDSPTSVLPTQCKLQTILSGKETPNIDEVAEKPQVGSKRRNRGNSCKSLTDLEFEELKGFMDLGFVFCEEDKNTSLVSVVPGLKRLGKEDDKRREEEERAIEKKTVSRPYLSEAWEVRNHRKGVQKPLMVKWNFPSISNEADMKNQLKCWAHTVATAVR